MKKNIFNIISLLTILTITGCNGENSSNTNTNSNTNKNTNTNSTQQSTSSSSIDDNKIEYKIKVLLDQDTSVGENVSVQVCKVGDGGLCVSSTTDSQGVATFRLEPATYSIDKIDYDGYALEYGLKVDENNRNYNVILHEIQTPTSGDGTENAPYAISEGVYRASVDENGDIQHYGMTFTEVGTYALESWSNGTLVDPMVISFDERLIDAEIVDPSKSEVKYGNFKISFEVKEENLNTQYVFSISHDGSLKSKKEYNFVLKKI